LLHLVRCLAIAAVGATSYQVGYMQGLLLAALLAVALLLVLLAGVVMCGTTAHLCSIVVRRNY